MSDEHAEIPSSCGGPAMHMTRRAAAAAVAAALAIVAAAGAAGSRSRSLGKVRRFKTLPRVRCDLPEHDYQAANPGRMALAISFRAELVRASAATPPAAPADARSYVFFQLGTARMGVDQCSIARVALLVWDNGSYILSFRADQNAAPRNVPPEILPGASLPANPPQILPGSSARTKVTANIKRNQFQVKVRGMAAFDVPDDPNVTPGRPVLFEIATDKFWVQNGEPQFPRITGKIDEIAIFFSDIDRVEVELSYR